MKSFTHIPLERVKSAGRPPTHYENIFKQFVYTTIWILHPYHSTPSPQKDYTDAQRNNTVTVNFGRTTMSNRVVISYITVWHKTQRYWNDYNFGNKSNRGGQELWHKPTIELHMKHGEIILADICKFYLKKKKEMLGEGHFCGISNETAWHFKRNFLL